jgi:hypothetical protein
MQLLAPPFLGLADHLPCGWNINVPGGQKRVDSTPKKSWRLKWDFYAGDAEISWGEPPRKNSPTVKFQVWLLQMSRCYIDRHADDQSRCCILSMRYGIIMEYTGTNCLSTESFVKTLRGRNHSWPGCTLQALQTTFLATSPARLTKRLKRDDSCSFN